MLDRRNGKEERQENMKKKAALKAFNAMK